MRRLRLVTIARVSKLKPHVGIYRLRPKQPLTRESGKQIVQTMLKLSNAITYINIILGRHAVGNIRKVKAKKFRPHGNTWMLHKIVAIKLHLANPAERPKRYRRKNADVANPPPSPQSAERDVTS